MIRKLRRSNGRFAFVGVPRPDRPIYRVMSRSRFLEVLKTRSLVLVQPKLWDDPFESFLLRGQVRYPSGIWMSMRDLHEQFYAQCWTSIPESDALWRIYSPKKTGVIVSTSPRRLLDAAARSVAIRPGTAACVGAVQYRLPGYFKALMQNRRRAEDMIFTEDIRRLATSFLLKREAFSHECEVRLIVRETKSEVSRPLFQRMRISPNAFFDSVRLDPRAGKDSYRRLKAAAKRLGFRRPILQSELYRLPGFRLRLDL